MARIIDPHRQGDERASRKHGVATRREIVRSQELAERHQETKGVEIQNSDTVVMREATKLRYASGNGVTVTPTQVGDVVEVAAAIDTSVTVDKTTAQTLSNKTLDNTNAITVKDANFTIQDDSDTTKQLKIRADALTHSSTVTLDVPNASTTLMGIDSTQNVSNKTLLNSNQITVKDSAFTIQDNVDTTKQLKIEASGIATGTTRTLTAQDADGTIALTATTQPLDAELTALAGLVSAANKLPYFTGSGTAALADLSAFIRTLLDDADAATARGTIGAAPVAAKYITQTADAELSAEQALGSLATGMLKNTTTTGVLSIGTDGTDYLSPTTGAPIGAKYITQTADANLTNEQALGALATGILKSTTTTGVLSIAVGADLPSHTHAEADVTNLTTDLAGKQPLDTDLTAIAALTSAADKVPYATGAGTWALADFPSAMRTFLTTPSSANLAALLSDETGSGANVHATRPTITLQDTITTFQDDGDNTKQANFDLANITTGTTRTYKVPNASDALGLGSLGYLTPPGPVVIDASSVTALTTGKTGARYLGYVDRDVTSVEVNVAVTTGVATAITWAEVALASANSATGGNMTLLGSATSVTATFNTTGVKTVTFSVTVPAGTFLYFLFGSAATTPFQLRATLADELGVGVTRQATARPSTMAAPTAFSTSSAITYAAWCLFRWS